MPKQMKEPPIPNEALSMEFMTSIYPFGIGVGKDGKAYLFLVNDDETGFVKKEIDARTLQRLAEVANETLDNMGRLQLGVKTK